MPPNPSETREKPRDASCNLPTFQKQEVDPPQQIFHIPM